MLLKTLSAVFLIVAWQSAVTEGTEGAKFCSSNGNVTCDCDQGWTTVNNTQLCGKRKTYALS